MIIGIGFAMVALVVVLVGMPLLRPESGPVEEFVDEDDPSLELERRKVGAMTALSELEYDYGMNKVSTEDYEALKAKLTREAVSVLKEEEELLGEPPGGEGPGLEERISREIDAEIERLLAEEQGGGPAAQGGVAAARYCHACGAALVSDGQKFCHACGTRLAAAEGGEAR